MEKIDYKKESFLMLQTANILIRKLKNNGYDTTEYENRSEKLYSDLTNNDILFIGYKKLYKAYIKNLNGLIRDFLRLLFSLSNSIRNNKNKSFGKG